MIQQTTKHNTTYTQHITDNNSTELLKIILHNTRGINNDIKKQTWLEYCKKKDADIICITETKLAT